MTAMSLLQDPRIRHFVSRLALGVTGAEVIVTAVPAFARRPLST